MRLHHSLPVACDGVNHMDFTRRRPLSCWPAASSAAGCSRSTSRNEKVVGTLTLPAGAMPQDVKLSPDGRDLLRRRHDVATASGCSTPTASASSASSPPAGAPWPLRQPRLALPVRLQPREGSVSVISLRHRRLVHKWRIPGGGSPDMGGVSADGKVLWLLGPLRRRGLRDRHGRQAAGADPGRQRPARPLRLPARRALLARPHWHLALAGRRSRFQSCRARSLSPPRAAFGLQSVISRSDGVAAHQCLV